MVWVVEGNGSGNGAADQLSIPASVWESLGSQLGVLNLALNPKP